MLFAFAYLLLRRLVQLVAGSSNHLNSDVEIVVLRHQLMVLKRRVGRPRLCRRDRLLMAAIRRARPGTLLTRAAIACCVIHTNPNQPVY